MATTNGKLELITANWGDASTGYGSNNTLTVLIQVPPPPQLSILPVGPGSVAISWPLTATNFVLQTNIDLATTNWATASYTVTTNGTKETVTVDPTGTGSLHFRLMAQ